jgi:Trk-type K+ transport system membrane component
MTGALVALLLAGGMSLFDALIHAFGTLATGGFSDYSASIAAFGSLYIEVVITVFMLMSGINFTLHYRLLARGQPGPLLRSPEVRMYLALASVTGEALRSGLHVAVPDDNETQGGGCPVKPPTTLDSTSIPV